VIAVSERLRDFAVSLGISPRWITTIPNGIDSVRFSMRERLKCRKNHGLSQEIRLVLSVGLLIERKGHHRVIQVLKALRQRGVNAQLLIIGSSGREDRFEYRIRRIVSDLRLQEVVHFLGHVPQETLAELMSAADVLCLASDREGWPNFVHEALTCGTPVVATDVGGIPALIQSDDYRFIVPVNDQAALQEALLNTLQKRWNREIISEWGRSRTWKIVAQEVFQEIEQLTAEKVPCIKQL
jgi:glycosyltransferase involved in cell wall biosynthesis